MKKRKRSMMSIPEGIICSELVENGGIEPQKRRSYAASLMRLRNILSSAEDCLLGSYLVPDATSIPHKCRSLLGPVLAPGNLICAVAFCYFWSLQPGLNWWPHPYHGCALPTELWRHLVPSVGLEPTLLRIKSPLFYQLNYKGMAPNHYGR